MIDILSLHDQRLERWCQIPETRTTNPEAAVGLIARVGVATLFPASPEIPNLFHAYVGDPHIQTSAQWDSPAGHVYGWRWALGRQEAAFYTAIVRCRPTWISWNLLPAMICLRGELRRPDELQGVSLLTIDASKVRLTLLAPAARREGLEAALRRSRLIVCRLVSLLHSCSRCDTSPPGRVPVPGC